MSSRESGPRENLDHGNTPDHSAKIDKMLGALLGGIVGDAFGSPYQFKARGSYEITNDMEYCKHFNMPPGSFTDDSSMMLCLAESLVERGGFDANDQMERYWQWLTRGYMSSSERGAFDIGNATMRSIMAYGEDRRHGRPLKKGYGIIGVYARGNGGIMRLAPIPVYYHADHAATITRAAASSAVTHAEPECLDAAVLMAHVMHKLLNGASKAEACDNAEVEPHVFSEKIKALCRGEYKSKSRDEISTKGYVVDTLEAALWTLHTCETYEAGIKTLAAMGDDVDTTCCVYGQLAGALWGLGAIPHRWLGALQCMDTVKRVCTSLVAAALA